MGFWSPRAICPSCGAKIHTQPGLVTERTGMMCPYCHVGLTGSVSMATGKAKLAPPENPHVGRKFVSPVPSSSAARQRAPEPDPEFQKRLDALGNKWAAERPAREEKKAIETQTRLAEESAAAVGAGGADIAERLAQLVQMKEAGHLTPEEFEDAKRQALGNKQFENTSEVAEQVEFDVILESSGRKKLQVIQTVRQLTVLGLREAKDLVEGAPNPVLQGVSEESAWMAKEALEGVGATVTIS